MMKTTKTIEEYEAACVAAANAEKETLRVQDEAVERAKSRADELSEAEHRYHADPSDEIGREVISARSNRDLAELRCERAEAIAKAATEARAAAESALARAKLEAEVEATRARFAGLLAREGEVTSARRAAHPLEAIKATLEFTCAREYEAIKAQGEYVDECGEVFDELTALEEQLGAMVPELAPELAAVKAERTRAHGALFAKRATPEAFQDTIASDLALIIAAERIIGERLICISSAFEGQQLEAAAARALGAEVAGLHVGHEKAHIAHARFMAQPEQGNAAWHEHANQIRKLFDIHSIAIQDPEAFVKGVLAGRPGHEVAEELRVLNEQQHEKQRSEASLRSAKEQDELRRKLRGERRAPGPS